MVFINRTEVGAVSSAAMLACGIAIPPRLQGIPPPDTQRLRRRPRHTHPAAGADSGVVPRLPDFAEFAHENRHLTFFTVQGG